jgi:dipeptide/tripeptide permease
MTGTVLGAVKTGIPIGGVIIPLLVTTFTATAGFSVALWVLPLGLLAGLILLSLPAVPSLTASAPELPV